MPNKDRSEGRYLWVVERELGVELDKACMRCGCVVLRT